MLGGLCRESERAIAASQPRGPSQPRSLSPQPAHGRGVDGVPRPAMLSSLIASVAALQHAAVAASFLDMWTTHNCSGPPNMTVPISSHNESLCTGCWDHCAWMQKDKANKGSFPSMKLRGPSKVAVNGNCIGKYGYAGGWSDAALGGVFSEADGCHEGGASAVILCGGTIKGIQDDLEEICGTPLAPPSWPSTGTGEFQLLDPEKFASYLGADLEWAKQQVPFIDVEFAEEADTMDLLTTYYYRWRSYKKHIKWTADGYILTEFLPYVPWSGRHNAIPAAAGHHIMEGRWLHNQQVVADYIAFWFADRQLDQSFGGTLGYTSWIGHAAW